MIKINTAQSVFLDILRLTAVQLVVVGHAINSLSVYRVDFLQNYAVVIFFILSGIVISYSTFYKMQSFEYDFKSYFIDRASRIYVAFIPCLFFVAGLDLLQIYLKENTYHYYAAFNLRSFIGNILMLQDFPFQHYFTSFGSARPFWTLAVEWWLYMAFGIVVFKLKKNSFVNLLFLCCCCLVPVYHFIGRGNSLTVLWFLGVMITILTMSGNLIYKINNLNKKYFIFLNLFLGCGLLLRFRITHDSYDLGVGVITALLIGLNLGYLARYNKIQQDTTRYNKIQQEIKILVGYSFTLYLVHYTILDFITNIFLIKIFEWQKLIVYLVISLIVCNLIAKVIALFSEVHYKKVSKYLRSRLS